MSENERAEHQSHPLSDELQGSMGPLYGGIAGPIFFRWLERRLRAAGHGPQLDDWARQLSSFRSNPFVVRLRRIYRLRVTILATVAIVAAFVVGRWDLSVEFGYVLRHVCLAGVSVVAGWSYGILWANIFLGGAYLLIRGLEPFVEHEALKEATASGLGRALRALVQLNRQAGHLEALLPWLVIVCISTTSFWLQLVGCLGVTTLGALAADAIAGLVRGDWKSTPREFNEAELHWDRRIVFHLASLVGLLILLSFNLEQLSSAWPLALAVGTGVVLRTLAWLTWYRWVRRKEKPGQLAIRRSILEHAAPVDRIFGLAALTILAFSPVYLLAQGLDVNARAQRARTTFWTSCEADPDGFQRETSLFLLADTQFHEVGGSLNGGQVDLVDSIVPVALRPIEQDLLSGVTLAHFARLYRQLSAQSPAPMLWAHLGDIGDLGCQGELDRFKKLLPAFSSPDGPRKTLAAIAPGNHDSTFTGNFEWHPDWSTRGACPSGRVDKYGEKGTNALFASMEDPFRIDGADMSYPEHEFLAHVVPIGTLQESYGREPVVGVFLDTSAFGRLRLGVAGVKGTVSQEQLDWVAQKLKRAGERAFVVVFQHHPHADLDPGSKRRMITFLDQLAERGLAVISAHTHQAGPRRLDLRKQRSIPEFVIGSTTDAPQEAAVLDIGHGGDGRRYVRVTTVPAVSRDSMTCSYASPLTSGECSRLLTALEESSDECRALLNGDRSRLEKSADCKNDSPLPDVTVGSQRVNLADTPDEIKCGQQDRAALLLRCIGSGPTTRERQPLNKDYDYDALALACRDGGPACSPDREDTLVCLSWATSILQEHKAKGWALPQAVHYAWEPLAIPGARSMVAPKRPPSPVKTASSAPHGQNSQPANFVAPQ